MNFFLNLKDKVNINLLYLFTMCLPLGQKLSTYALIAWVISSLICFKPSKVISQKSFLFLPALYLIYVLSLIYSETFSLKFFEQKASLLAFPIIFYLNGFNYNTEVLNKTLRVFVIGCILSVIFCYAFALYNSIDIVNNSIVFNPQIDTSLEFIESSVKGGNYFYGTHFSTFHHTTYYAMFLCFAISILLFSTKQIQKRYVKFSMVFLLIIAVFQVSSRAGIVTLFFILLYYIYLSFKKRIFLLISSVTLLVILPLLFLFNPRVKNLVNNIVTKGVSFHNEDVDSAALRLMAWDASIQVFKKHPIIGVGVGDGYKALKNEYKIKRYVTPFRESLNAHNQYLQLLVECGVLGLIIFLICIRNLIKLKQVNSIIRKILFSFIAIIIFNCFFESILNHYSGISFFSFFYCLFISYNMKKTVLINNEQFKIE